MNSKSSKPIAGRVAEHNSWPAERCYALGRDTMDMGELWDPRRGRSQAASLCDILTLDRIKVPLDGGAMGEAVAELVDLFVQTGDLHDRDQVLEAIVSREQTSSTGVGGGVAIPHAKTSQVSGLVMAVGTCACPIDFDSVDGAGVRIVVMLLSPIEMTAQHIWVMDRITGMMNCKSVRSKLLQARSPEALYKIICRHEAAAA